MSLFLIGPSGVGKSTLKERLLKDYPHIFEESISCTTRSPRAGEKDGNHYYFIDDETFDEYVEEDYFLEWEEVHGKRYGTLQSEVKRIQDKGMLPIFDIDLHGANNLLVRLKEPKENVIFILPENFEELKKRLEKRETESEEQINTRLKRAEWEIKQAKNYPFKIVNKDFEQTYKELLEILKKQHGSTYEF